jgi:hypothetical protein
MIAKGPEKRPQRTPVSLSAYTSITLVGDTGAVCFRKPGTPLQGGYPPHTVRRHRSDEDRRGLVTGITDSIGRVGSSQRLTSPAAVSAWSGCWALVYEVPPIQNSLLVTGNPSTAHDRHTATGTPVMACTTRVPPERARSRPEFRNSCRVLTASSPTGGGPQTSRRACRPRIPPAPNRR